MTSQVTSQTFAAQTDEFLGRWALTTAGGGAGWLEVRDDAGYLDGTLLWVGGSPEPLTRVYFDGDTLGAIRIRTDQIKDATGKVTRTQVHPLTLTASLSGDRLRGVLAEPAGDGRSVTRQEFTGERVPPLPPRPELSKVRFGEPHELFNGKNLDGWVVLGGPHWGKLDLQRPDRGNLEGWLATNSNAASGWSVENGILINNPTQRAGQPYVSYGNLHTVRKFEDFNLAVEVNVGPNGNSGIYLRGIYEVQVADSFGKPVDSHHLGAVYGRITPTASAEKPPGKWQTLDITLVDRHVTVKLNGQTIIENQPLMGCTGGAVWSDESRPGPIYLQGDHTDVRFRKIVLRPVVK
ncbi:MAG: DUF1080 domain-containing protein [Planctomycetes bacterium]|nr:DUF1080 domain-containing protein [Planctomycetota bacterium]